MKRLRLVGIGGLVVLAALLVAGQTSPKAGLASSTNLPPEEVRAVAFLTREVPQWKVQNDCYSCHNNGDATRALITAASRGHAVGAAIDDTLEWLRDPRRWDKNKTEGGIDDKPLARVQFAAALKLAVESGKASREALRTASLLLVADQKPDGSWQLDLSQSIGSPTTYGTALATTSARRTISSIDEDEVKRAAGKADVWLRAAKVETVLDAAAVILALERARDTGAMMQRQRAIHTLIRGQTPAGGWGAYVTSAPQVFDTAVVVLSLAELQRDARLAAPLWSPDQLRSAVARGREFLVSQQMPDGSWPETTRPPNQESYAQRISTTGWALLALMQSR